MIYKNLTKTTTFLVGAVLGTALLAGTLVGCTDDANLLHGRDSDNAIVSQEISKRGGEGIGGEQDHEHIGGSEEGSDSEGGEGAGVEGAESGGDGGAEGTGGEGHGSQGENGSEGNGGNELNEAAMSSPIIPLDQTWQGTLGPLAIDARYAAATRSVISTVQNITSQKVCYVQAEPHLKSGTTTVGELGPDKLGDLNPGQTATTNMSVASEPALVDVVFDGYVVHMEVFDCAGPGPQPHPPGQGGEGGAEGAGGEGHGPGGEGGNEGSGGEEGSATNQLAPDETFDLVQRGARLIMSYDASTNSFKGTVENTTNGVLTRVRIEIHLSNGTELGPTTPIDMAPGQKMAIELPSTAAPFTGWIPHAEIGSGDGGGEHGAAGSDGGEGRGSEGGGEHGSGGREGGGEHGGRGEGRGGG